MNKEPGGGRKERSDPGVEGRRPEKSEERDVAEQDEGQEHRARDGEAENERAVLVGETVHERRIDADGT